MAATKGHPGFRHRVNYRNESMYVTVVHSKAEVFISSANQDLDPLTGAAIDALTRMVSMAWRYSTLEIAVAQLRKASRSDKDLPGILARLIMEDDFDDDIRHGETD